MAFEGKMSSNRVIHLTDRESQSPRNQRRYPNDQSPATRTRSRRNFNDLENGNRIGGRRHGRKSPARNNNEVINLEPSFSPNDRETRRIRRGRPKNATTPINQHEVINLESDTSPSSPTPTRKRRKFTSSNSDDVEIIQIKSPPHLVAAARSLHSACAAAASSVLKQSTEKSSVDRIREVFPTMSRSKVQNLLRMASSYTHDDEEMVATVMTVLADNPSGEVSEKAFAAAAVGGRLDDNESDDDNSPSGKKKVAHLECLCCYTSHPFESMISCRSGHLFCTTCVKRHTETRVFGVGNFGVNNGGGGKKGKAWEILCMHSDGCGSGFREGELRKVLDEKQRYTDPVRSIRHFLYLLYLQVMKKYDELQYQAVVEGFNDTSKCPKCSYIAFAPEDVSTFHCPQCSFKSCRECGEEAHPGIKCDEVEKKHETSGRNKVEEAMSEAVIRKCPRPMCRKPFMKTDGCNKITCSCGAFICYLCRKEIPKEVSYKHFCQTPHCNHSSCNKCGLYTNADTADQIAVRKAAETAAKSVSTGRKGITVDVDSLMKNPGPTHGNQTHAMRQGGPAHNAVVANARYVQQQHFRQQQQRMQQQQQQQRMQQQQQQMRRQQMQMQRAINQHPGFPPNYHQGYHPQQHNQPHPHGYNLRNHPRNNRR